MCIDDRDDFDAADDCDSDAGDPGDHVLLLLRWLFEFVLVVLW